jgi:hypothetical protein
MMSTNNDPNEFGDHYTGEVSSNLSYQALQEQRAKENTAMSNTDTFNDVAQAMYDEQLYLTTAARVASVPGVKYDSFEDYLNRVDQMLAKVKNYQGLTSK